MEKKIQLDKKKISKQLMSVRAIYPLYKNLTLVLGLLLPFVSCCFFASLIFSVSGYKLSKKSFIAMICILILIFIFNKAAKSVQKKYELTFKKLMVEPILKSSFNQVTYFPEKGFSKSEIKKMNLLYVSLDNHFESEDMIESEYMGVKFKQSDILLSHYSHDDDNRKTSTDREGRTISVDGRVTRFPYKTNIKGIVQIATRKGIKWKHYMGKTRFEVEDVEFNKHFDVFADDEHSVFYALTPQMIDYFNSLRLLNGEQISATLDGEYLYVLRYGKGGVFKADIKEKFDADAKEKQIYAEIAEIENLIKVLHLHKRV